MSHLSLSAGALGVANHLYFKNFEPSIVHAFVLCTIEPPLLLVGLGAPFALLSLGAAYATFLLALSLSIVTYRLSPWHPLASIPGPTLLKVSKVFLTWKYSQGRFRFYLKELHDSYGPIVRTGPNEVSVADADAITNVLSVTGLNLPRGTFYKAMHDPLPTAPRPLLHLLGAAHSKRRRLWTRGMSPDALKEYQVIIGRRVAQLVDVFQRKIDGGDDVVDMTDWFRYIMTDVTGDLAFGGGYEFLSQGSDGGMWERTHQETRIVLTLMNLPWLIAGLFTLPPVKKALQKTREDAERKSIARAQSGASTKDLWYYLMDEASRESDKLTIGELGAEASDAMIAGVDTASLTMTTCLYLLLSSKEYYERAKQEVERVYPRGEDSLSSAKHDQLPFLDACINETLRLHAPLPTGGPREIPKNTEAKLVAGHVLAPGTQIWNSPFPRHRNPEYFSYPDSFLPERWLKGAKGFENHEARAFTPFSLGPASCPGKMLARQEMLMIMSNLLREFDFQFPGKDEELKRGLNTERWAEDIKDYFLADVGPMCVKIRHS